MNDPTPFDPSYQETVGESSGGHQQKLQRAAEAIAKQDTADFVMLTVNWMLTPGIYSIRGLNPQFHSVGPLHRDNPQQKLQRATASLATQDTQAPKDNRQQLVDSLMFSVNGMLSKVHRSYSPPCIYRVPYSIRGVNPQCYTPRLVSIGPLHRYNPYLKPAEGLKIKYFNNFLNRQPTDEQKLPKMLNLVVDLESEIRKNYPPDEMIKLNSEDFCRIILVDATFVAELIIVRTDEGDPMSEKRWFSRDLLNDILLIENQIPLFIIYEIYSKFYKEDKTDFPAYGYFAEKDTFLIRVHIFFKNMKNVISTDAEPLPKSILTSSSKSEGYPLHFIDYLRKAYGFGVSDSKCFISSDPNVNLKQEQVHSRLKSIKGKEKVLDDGLPPSSLEDGLPSSQNRRPGQTLLPPKKNKNWKFDVVTASRLLKYGVKFREGTITSRTSRMCIKFRPKEGILIMNKIIVNEYTENIFRNIVAYEQCDLVSQTHVSDYLIFMDNLIDTPEDVNILTDAGIIQNDLQDDEKVSQMFNTLHKEVITERRDYLFAAQSRELNDYRRNMWHRWNATWYNWKSILKRDYFNSPWSTLAIIIAAILLGLTIVQTVCSIYQAKGIEM